MARGDSFRAFHGEQRAKMLEQISEVIDDMRAEGRTITKASIAKELGINRQNLNADYVKAFLQEYSEFSPDREATVSVQEIEQAKLEIQKLKSKLAEVTKSNKTLKMELAAAKAGAKKWEDRYRQLLGEYQRDEGEKIVYMQK